MSTTQPARRSILEAIILILIFATIPAAGGIWVVDHNAKVKQGKTDFAQCDRGNLVRGYLRSRSTELPSTTTGARASTLFPILDCQATIAEARQAAAEGRDPRGVPLSRYETAQYQKALTAGRLPVVKDGKVIGSKALPAP
jgi:hypothetical protein